jgi:hypothetical protein
MKLALDPLAVIRLYQPLRTLYSRNARMPPGKATPMPGCVTCGRPHGRLPARLLGIDVPDQTVMLIAICEECTADLDNNQVAEKILSAIEPPEIVAKNDQAFKDLVRSLDQSLKTGAPNDEGWQVVDADWNRLIATALRPAIASPTSTAIKAAAAEWVRPITAARSLRPPLIATLRATDDGDAPATGA